MYALRQYSFPLLLAVAMHGGAIWSLYRGWNPEKDLQNVVMPKAVVASLLVLEAKQPKVDLAAIERAKAAAAARKAAQDKAARDAATEKKAEQDRAELARKERADNEKAAQDRLAQENARKELERLERMARLSELAETSMQDAIALENAEMQSGSEEAVVQSYHAAIYDLVRRNWSRPPSARTGMSVRVQVELIPTGEVIAVTIVDSSGNAAFDRSAEHAVQRAGRFEVPQENNLFEAHFRRFYILFKPEDLLR
ncbi:MAG: cell envelope integrity protein TolA [Pseudomonadales bacterium]|nr:cell envelope integrity protein TolA [Pseudomonadales bacterium]